MVLFQSVMLLFTVSSSLWESSGFRGFKQNRHICSTNVVSSWSLFASISTVCLVGWFSLMTASSREFLAGFDCMLAIALKNLVQVVVDQEGGTFLQRGFAYPITRLWGSTCPRLPEARQICGFLSHPGDSIRALAPGRSCSVSGSAFTWGCSPLGFQLFEQSVSC